MKRISAIAAMLTLCLGLSSHAALAAVPGDACSPNGVAGVNGVMQMTCTSGVWVLNALKLGNSSVTCDSGNAGYIKWDGTGFSGCNGTSWGLTVNGAATINTGGVATVINGTVLAQLNLSGGNGTGDTNQGAQLVMTNLNANASVRSKFIRVAGNGDLQIISSNYATAIVNIADDGRVTLNNYLVLSAKSAAPVACSSIYKGSIAMTTNNGLCFCNGTAWNKVEAPATACAW